MYTIITRHAFHDAFNARRPDSFSYEALNLLYEYFEEYPDFELDVGAIDCEFCESSQDDVLHDYPIEIDPDDVGDEDAINDTIEAYLNYRTCLIGQTSHDGGSFVFASF